MSELYSDLSIFIPTYRRAGRVKTIGFMSKQALKVTALVVRPDEYTAYFDAYSNTVGICCLPTTVTNLSKTRQWILDHAPTRYVMMLDDDLEFHYRPDINSWNLKKFGLADGPMFDDMVGRMMAKMQAEGIVHCAVSPVEGNSHYIDERRTMKWNYGLRYMRAYIFDISVVGHFKYADECSGCEDFELALQLTEAGHQSVLTYAYAQTHKANEKGGLDKAASVLSHNAAMEDLKRRHPDFVRLVPKPRKKDKLGNVWVDAVISWKKAYGTCQLLRKSRAMDDGVVYE